MEKASITVKKYPNRRLYRTDKSKYITLEDLATMVKNGEEFTVVDAKTKEDITRSILVQIIFEQESKGDANILPVNFLKKLIGFYGDNLTSVLPGYLEASMEAFTRNQEKMQEFVKTNLDGLFPLQRLEELRKQNMEMITKSMELMSQWNPVVGYWKDKGK